LVVDRADPEAVRAFGLGTYERDEDVHLLRQEVDLHVVDLPVVTEIEQQSKNCSENIF